jgi:serine/threonine-protein kinase
MNFPALATAFEPREIRAQVEAIVANPVFSRSRRLNRFLRFTVEQVLNGRGEELKEQLIGVEVFDRKADYDPRIDPIVRVEARRLRGKLKAYYEAAGRNDPVILELRTGTYVPVFRRRGATPPAAQKKPVQVLDNVRSIVVLPFANLVAEPEEDYFSDGLTEELINYLTRIPKFRVLAWNSASQLRGRDQDLSGIREQLNVDTVLRGSVRRDKGQVRVAAQLIDAKTGVYLWSETYARELQDVFAIQEEMARAIVTAMDLKLDLPAGGHRSTPNLACYNLCLQGRFHANKRTQEGLRKSVACFEQAVAADGSSAAAFAGLADAYSLMADYGVDEPAEVMPKARAAAERALTLDPRSAEANVSLAFVRSLHEWNWWTAESLYRSAIWLNPGYAQARHWFGLDYLALLGRMDEAIVQLQIAHDLDPLSQIIREGCGYVQLLRRDYAKAVSIYRELIELDPSFYKAHSSMGRAFFMMERYEEALASFENARRLAGEVPSIVAGIGQTLARLGRTEEARACLADLCALAKRRWVSAGCFAVVYMGVGDHDRALTWIETALERREISVTAFKVHPMYDPLRSEPRFQRVIEQIGFLP